MDGLPKSKSANGSSLRRAAQKCPPDRLAASRCRRSASRRLTGNRRAKKQLRQCLDSTANNSDSDASPPDYLNSPCQQLQNLSTACSEDKSICERLGLVNNERIFFDNKHSRRSVNTTNSTKFVNSNTIPRCYNCGDYISRPNLQTSYRSLPSYSIGNIENPHSVDLSPDSSSGPISFDSGIEQHNSLPYARSLNSSPYVASTLPYPHARQDLLRHNVKDNLLFYSKLSNKPLLKLSNSEDFTNCSKSKSLSDDKHIDNISSEHNPRIEINTKSTKSVQTQTDSFPVKYIPTKILFDGRTPIDAIRKKVTLLELNNETKECYKDKKSWIKRPSTSSILLEGELERGYHSDSTPGATIEIIMPVGTSFENSAMKNSFSLSSLQGASGGVTTVGANGSPVRIPAPPERPYHSLTKKRKDPNRELWRRSWGSTHSNQSAHSLGSSATLAAKDDFWAALQYNYNYIMDNKLIDETCKEANGELNSDLTSSLPVGHSFEGISSPNQWSLKQLIAEFTELCQWLTSMQEEVYASPENLSNKTLRAARMKDLVSCEHKRLRFLEQAANILNRGEPEASAEVTWRARHFTLKWDSVLHAMSPEDGTNSDNHNNADAEHEVKCLRRWLHEMEKRLQPLSISAVTSWSRLQLEQKVKEHQVLQREVQWQGRIVSSVVRLCRPGSLEAAARALEHRWHLLYLTTLEWQFQLEACLARKETQGSSEILLSDSDEGPVVKHPRLVGPLDHSKNIDGFQHFSGRSSYTDEEESYSEGEVDEDQCDGLVPECYSLKDTSPGSEADTEGSVIDEDSDIIMESLKSNLDVIDNKIEMPSITKDLASLDKEDQVVIDTDTNRINEIDINNTLNSSMYDEDDQTVPVTVRKRPKKPVDLSKFNRSDRKSKNCATFYFKHHDTDSDRNLVSGSGTDDKSQEETSEEEWTYTMCNKNESPENSDVMTSSFEQQSDLPIDSDVKRIQDVKMKLNFDDADDSNLKSEIDLLNEKNSNMTNTCIDNSDNKTIIELQESTNLSKPIENIVHQPLCSKESIKRLLNDAEIMVLKKVQQMNAKEQNKISAKKAKSPRSLKPLVFNDDTGRVHSQSKISRIKEWLQLQHTDSSQLVLDSCDASGEYTTGDSEPDRLSVTSEDLSPSVATYRNVASSQEHSINIDTPTNHSTPEHAKVIRRNKRNNSQSIRPWSVSCLSQLSYATKDTPKTTRSGSTLNTPIADSEDISSTYGRSSGMSISESALNTLSSINRDMRGDSPKRGKYRYEGSTSSVKTAIQGNISSSTTINEGWNNAFGNLDDSKQFLTKRKRFKLKKRQLGTTSQSFETQEMGPSHLILFKKGNKLVKSCSFSGQLPLSQKDFKSERCTASDPSSSRNKRFDTTSTSDNDSDADAMKKNLQFCLGRSTDRTLNASSEDQENDTVGRSSDMKPRFKIGPEGGSVRPRLPNISVDVTSRSTLVELTADRDSDVDRSVQTAGTEEHSSLSEQAWDFYQEKYNSEPYSEAPDSDAARRLLECDDYRAYFDSQSDCCSSLSAHPDHEPSPLMNRRRLRAPNYSPTENNWKNSLGKGVDSNNYGSNGRRSKKSSTSSIDRKKSLMDSLERSKQCSENPEKIKRVKKIINEMVKGSSKRSSISDCDLNRRRYTSSNSTNSDANNSSLEYQHVKQQSIANSKADKKSRKQSFESNKFPLSVELALHDSTNNVNSTSVDSPMRRKRFSNSHMDDSSDGMNDSKNHSLSRRKGSSGILLSGSNLDNKDLDSDSDIDDVQHLIERSRSQLEDTELVLSKEDISMDLLQPNDYVRNHFQSEIALSDENLTQNLDCTSNLPDSQNEKSDKDEPSRACFTAKFCFAVALFSVVVFVCLNTYRY